MYAPKFDASKRGLVTDADQMRFDFMAQQQDPINSDSSLHFTRPRKNIDISPRPNFMIGGLYGLYPQIDVLLGQSARIGFGLSPTDPAGSALAMPQTNYITNGLKKVG